MKKRKVDRLGHAGKDRYEKEVYRQFLASKFSLDKTENDPIDTNKTSESTFEDEREEFGKIKKKSSWLKAKDLFRDNLINAFISGILLFMLAGYITLNRDQGVQGVQIKDIQEDLSDIKSTNQETKNSFDKLKERYDIFSTGVSKDIEFLKQVLKLE